MLECDLAHRQSVAGIICCTKSNATQCTTLRCSTCTVFASASYTSSLVANRYTYAPPDCRTLQHCRTLFPCQCISGMILLTPCSMVWDWRVLRAGPMPFYWPSCSLTFCLLLFSISLLSLGWCCGVGVFGLIGC